MLKKVILCLLVFALLLSFTACGSKAEPETEPEELGYILTNYSLLPDSITNIPCCLPDGYPCDDAFSTTSTLKLRDEISLPSTLAVAGGSWKEPVFFGSRI